MFMKLRTRRMGWLRRALLGAAALSLLAVGPCVQIAENALIDGFFANFNALLVALARERLGLP